MLQEQTYFFMTLGVPGSGKSYVCDWLTPKLRVVRLGSDELREKMFGIPLRLEFHDEPYNSMINAAMEYAATQCLAQNHSVIYDTNMNFIKKRNELRALAKQFDAVAIVIWVKAPFEIAKKRATTRDQQVATLAPDMSYVENMAATMDLPASDELVITIDGLQPLDQQQASFNHQLQKIREEYKV